MYCQDFVCLYYLAVFSAFPELEIKVHITQTSLLVARPLQVPPSSPWLFYLFPTQYIRQQERQHQVLAAGWPWVTYSQSQSPSSWWLRKRHVTQFWPMAFIKRNSLLFQASLQKLHFLFDLIWICADVKLWTVADVLSLSMMMRWSWCLFRVQEGTGAEASGELPSRVHFLTELIGTGPCIPLFKPA